MMQGEMLWYNAGKRHGYIRTENDERLFVDESGFRDGELPTGRCKGMTVMFERSAADAETPRAVDVHFVEIVEQRRARLRHARGGTSI
jgi:cold shock CspA family protein